MKVNFGKAKCLTQSEIEDRLKKANIQPTAQRIAICKYVLCEADHPTADDVKQWADKNFPKMSLATVYNTLNTLVAAGLLKEFKFPHSEKVVYDSNIEAHYHFIDEKTGELVDLSVDEVKVMTKLSDKFEIRETEVLLRGTRR